MFGAFEISNRCGTRVNVPGLDRKYRMSSITPKLSAPRAQFVKNPLQPQNRVVSPNNMNCGPRDGAGLVNGLTDNDRGHL